MLTSEAWNAFLKTLEEPPPNTVFVLATTEAHKVMPTIVDRCQRFDFARPSPDEIAIVLRRAAEAEGIDVDDGAVGAIARAANGSFRDALGTLDQLVAYGGNEIDDRRRPRGARRRRRRADLPRRPRRSPPATAPRRCAPRPRSRALRPRPGPVRARPRGPPAPADRHRARSARSPTLRVTVSEHEPASREQAEPARRGRAAGAPSTSSPPRSPTSARATTPG